MHCLTGYALLGIYIAEVEPGSVAEKAGLAKGDVIVKVNEMPFNAAVSYETAAAVSVVSINYLKMFFYSNLICYYSETSDVKT